MVKYGLSKGSVLLASLLLLGSFSLAEASGPWNYLFQLPAADSGVAIKQPSALSIDPVAKRYYVVDAQNGQLVSFDKDGKLLAVFNAGGALKTPVSMARTSSGMLWVVNRADNELLYINLRQQKVEHFKLKDASGLPIFPAKVAVDAQNRLYLLDLYRGAVLQMDDNLKVVQSYKGLDNGKGFVDFKLKGTTVWALDGLSRKLYHFDSSGQATQPVVLPGLEFAIAFEIDSAGQIYILDRHAGRVKVFGPDGDERFDFLDKGKRHGRLWYPKELHFDWEEKLCIVDEGNARIDIFTR